MPVNPPINPEYIKYAYKHAFALNCLDEARQILASYPPPAGLDAETLFLISFILSEAVNLICADRNDSVAQEDIY